MTVLGRSLARRRERALGSGAKVFAVISLLCAIVSPTWAEQNSVDAVAANVPVRDAVNLRPPKRAPTEFVGLNTPSVSDRWLMVGTSLPDGNQRSAVQVFQKHGSSWQFHSNVLSPDTGSVDDLFGYSIAIEGDTVAIGAPNASVSGERSGAVHVYRLHENAWQLDATLSPPVPVADSYFGNHVALDRETVVVGEARDAQPGGWAPNQAAYVFVADRGDWRLQATIPVPPTLAAKSFQRGSHGFGNQVDISGNTLALAARDGAYLYERSGETWVPQSVLIAQSDPGDPASYATFARSLDLDENTLVVSALGAVIPGGVDGAAVVYRRIDGQWTEAARLTAPDGAVNDHFGHWVAHDRGVVVVGAFKLAVGGQAEVGGAYVFRPDGSGWSLAHKLLPSDASKQKWTAYALDFRDDMIVMSAGTSSSPESADYVWFSDIR